MLSHRNTFSLLFSIFRLTERSAIVHKDLNLHSTFHSCHFVKTSCYQIAYLINKPKTTCESSNPQNTKSGLKIPKNITQNEKNNQLETPVINPPETVSLFGKMTKHIWTIFRIIKKAQTINYISSHIAKIFSVRQFTTPISIQPLWNS